VTAALWLLHAFPSATLSRIAPAAPTVAWACVASSVRPIHHPALARGVAWQGTVAMSSGLSPCAAPASALRMGIVLVASKGSRAGRTTIAARASATQNEASAYPLAVIRGSRRARYQKTAGCLANDRAHGIRGLCSSVVPASRRHRLLRKGNQRSGRCLARRCRTPREGDIVPSCGRRRRSRTVSNRGIGVLLWLRMLLGAVPRRSVRSAVRRLRSALRAGGVDPREQLLLDGVRSRRLPVRGPG